MKKIISSLIISTLIFTTISCENEDLDRLDTAKITGAAILRTLESDTPPINSLSPSNNAITVKVEFDDFKLDDTMSSVDVYMEFIDTSPIDNEILTFPEVQISTIDASEFTLENGSLVTTISVNIGDALNALNIEESVLYGGDIFLLRLALNTTNGEIFTSSNVGTKIQASSAFKSPFRYSAAVACPLPANLSGDWIIDMQDSYGDGWNGASISVSSGGVVTDYTIDASDGQFIITSPPAGELFTFTFNSGSYDEEVTYQITDPEGNVQANHGPTPKAGGIDLIVDFCE
ncbi:hypothetical protein [Cellulophaga baltica]|uniref:DUF4382 domain-containing protein n=1 Tax=Cellulophaga baltica 18 TaxID=1348584 RepID=A0AAU8RR19_9FLAO|nr:hypothetical protein [Cellulophaga baltica]AIZ40289.1 hypothetical protein M666_01050 [Cellulophaga baltica 18]WFO15704.1 hypothetical protein M601_018485 [Cellulophaga baltica 4]